MVYWILCVVFSSVIALMPLSVSAAPATNGTGLSISPLRHGLSLASGNSTKSEVIIGNQTEKPMTVTMSVKEFEVTDFTYNYIFKQPQDDWVKLSLTEVVLRPHESKKVAYTVSLPARAPPGGYYFSLFASTQIQGEGLPGTAQVVSLLYLTVKGDLVRTSILQNDSVPLFVTGSEVPYKFDVKDTGNVYFTAYFYGQLEGLFGRLPESGTSHLLMPGVVRSIESTVPAPLLPGVYKFTYGYKVDFASIVTTKSVYVIYIPPWSVAAMIFAIIAGQWLWQRRRKKMPKT